MGVQEIKFYEKYIGLPSLVGRGKKANFNYIKERVWKKLQWWERGSNECSGSSYSYLCHRMLQIPNRYFPWNWTLNKFWWGQRGDRRKINWLRWEEMTNSKWICGMGLRDLTMILYWPNKHEGCCMIGTPFSAKFSKQDLFLIALSWMQKTRLQPLCLEKHSTRKVCYTKRILLACWRWKIY